MLNMLMFYFTLFSFRNNYPKLPKGLPDIVMEGDVIGINANGRFYLNVHIFPLASISLTKWLTF